MWSRDGPTPQCSSGRCNCTLYKRGYVLYPYEDCYSKKLYCITSIASLITISKLHFFFCSIVQNWINLIRHELAGYIRELSGFLHRTLIYFSISSLLVSNKVRTMLVFRTKGLNKNKICCQVWSQGGGSYREKIMTHFLKSAGERVR